MSYVIDKESYSFAVFAYADSTYGEYIEQRTQWVSLDKAIEAKENWFKDRNTFIMAKVIYE